MPERSAGIFHEIQAEHLLKSKPRLNWMSSRSSRDDFQEASSSSKSIGRVAPSSKRLQDTMQAHIVRYIDCCLCVSVNSTSVKGLTDPDKRDIWAASAESAEYQVKLILSRDFAKTSKALRTAPPFREFRLMFRLADVPARQLKCHNSGLGSSEPGSQSIGDIDGASLPYQYFNIMPM
jgi:hypothetical protein